MGNQELHHPDPRLTAERDSFIDALVAAHRHQVLEIGCGTGEDGLAFVAAGINYVGLDPSEENIHLARARHLEAVVGTPAELPFAGGTFDAAWAMDALVEVSNTDMYGVMTEIMRVLRPGAPLAIGLRTGLQGQDTGGFDSPRSDEMVKSLFEPHGDIRSFTAWDLADGAGRYRFLVLAKP
ncbi:class I SAM-dependent methyltransferase [Arthrobacter sp. I2-34]|uniref:Class I SAM-dependent methyltransferase n=1 Tax=Arthrobacter hankyongi TaxID=2904801 RepID=A0ABS9L2E7_9MICC|nr:class I SAM-dependent methyltransferase [Arthrobacter hankyongi]MCG2620677.1 class I SAM-dependent methyltransferase [Arthrobacter hankyongi]